MLAPAPPPGRGWAVFENHLLAAALGAMMILPLVEAALRKLFGAGISSEPAIVQHLVLVAGMVGGAIAARQRKLLTLGFGEGLLKGKWRRVGRIVVGGVSTTVSAMLTLAAFRFVMSERGGGAILAYDIPVWMLQVVLPLGFGLITARIVRNAADDWRGRLMTLLVAAVIVAIIARPPMVPLLVPLALVAIAIATLLGAPLFTALGGAALVFFWGDGSPIGSLTVDHYGLVTNPTLPTVPLFTLAGYFLAEGGASRRLIRLFKALVGNVRGGPAILVALVCAFFTSFTGASGVTILALGGLLMPVLLEAGYSERTTLGLLTGTGSLGLLFPPCLPLIFYGVIANVDIENMFLGGIVPGMLLVAMTAAWGVSQAPRRPPVAQPAFDWTEARLALWEAKWELLIPVVALGGIFSGLATPVEAAAATAFYAFVVESFVYRDLHPARDVPRVMAESGILVGGVLLVLGVALGFTNYLAFAEVPARAVEWVTASVHSPQVFLLLLNLFLIAVGALMDIYSAIVIVVPLIVPLGQAFGIDPVHLGIVFLANAELGYLMPPVGENLFLSSLRFNQPVARVFRAVLPMVVVFLLATLLITYIPAMTTTLPRLFGRPMP